MALSRLSGHAERILYRVAGLPVALGAFLASSRDAAGDPLLSAFARSYWHPEGLDEWSELVGGLVAWPLALLIGCLWFTLRNGTEVRRRHGKGLLNQVAEQTRLYFSAGVLAPGITSFPSTMEMGATVRKAYLQRFETKPSLFPLLKRRCGSPLNDKIRFAEYCAERGIRCVETIVSLDGKHPAAELPDKDLFVKPSRGRGGRGAERWDRVAPGIFTGLGGQRLTAGALISHLAERSRYDPIVVQPRLDPHPGLRAVGNGALPTVRIVTCLDEQREPELIGAVFRMSVGSNRTVDNLHAGGIAANVALVTGTLRVLPIWDQTPGSAGFRRIPIPGQRSRAWRFRFGKKQSVSLSQRIVNLTTEW